MDHSLVDILKNMSIAVQIVMIFMLGMSIYMAYRVIDRIITFSKAAGETVRFVLGLREQLKNQRYDEVQRVAQSFRYSPVAKVVGAGTAAYRQGQDALSKQGPNDVGDFDLVATAIIAYIIKAVIGLRPTEEVERQGLDINEHGEEGYVN